MERNAKEMIYLVEDDNNIRKLITYTLNSNGMETKGFARPSEFWQSMKEKLPRLILLDIMLPEEDGLEILKKIRSASSTQRIPVIMLTAKSAEYDKVIGLDMGADDYIPKPFGMMELISRIKAVLRRTDPEQNADIFTHGDLAVSVSRHEVTVNGEPVLLTLKEFELLCTLLKNRGIVLTRDRLLNEIWGYSFDGESRTVDVHVRKLRQKLGQAGECIETVKGVGYKIAG